jgi:hypothetical protein
VSTTSLDQGSLEAAIEQIERQIASIAEQSKPGMTTPGPVETSSSHRSRLFSDSFSSQV